MGREPAPPLSGGIDRQTFESICALVRRHSGIVLSDRKEAMVSARLAKRMRALNIPIHRDYLEYLKKDQSGEELTHLLDAISTNVTSFYREPVHFEFFSHWLAKNATNRSEPLRIWCAAASTGEEPYTIAITVREALQGPSPNARILATDISTRVLRHAMAGVYEAQRVEPVTRKQLDTWFIKRGDGTFEVRQDLKELIRYRRFNLSHFPYPVKPPLDIIFCRNVMIYFDDDLRARIVAEFHRLLRPGGILFVGHSECLTGLSTAFRAVAPATYQSLS